MVAIANTHPAPREGGACIKGAAFREFVLWYEQKVGAEAFGDRMSRLPPWMKKELDVALPGLGLSETTWYADITVHRLLDILTEGMSAGQKHGLALQGAAHVINSTLTGPFRILFGWMASPERYASYGQRLWNSYYDSGDFHIEPTEDGGGAICVIRNWKTHHPFICDLNRSASIHIYKAMRCADVSCIRHSCVAEGGSECRFVTRWRR